MSQPLRVIGIAGSLRKGSYNRALLNAAGELMPAGMTLDIFERLGEIPHYNADLQAQGFPEPVLALRDQVSRADALLVATPEYNFSIPGVLKNALDWVSRPDVEGRRPLDRKPAAIMGAATGAFGTVRAQTHLRDIFVYLNVFPVNKPEVLVMFARDKFDSRGRLTDDTTRGFVRDLMLSLRDHTLLLKTAPSVAERMPTR